MLFRSGFTGLYDSDYRIEFEVEFDNADAEKEFNSYAGVTIAKVAVEREKFNYSVTAGYPKTYKMVFRANEKISENDLKVIKGIFGMASMRMIVPPHIVLEPQASSRIKFIILLLNSLSTIIFSKASSVIWTEILDPQDIESISDQISFLKFSKASLSETACVCELVTPRA